jgi:MoxR-like ATPase
MIDDLLIDKSEFDSRFRKLVTFVGQRLLGKQHQIELALVCLLADGHLLLEDLPGLGKTTLANALADAFGGVYHRVQGTPDLMPADITGSVVLHRSTDSPHQADRSIEFRFRPGPVFANVLLCDEINRTPPRTQSALLEAMEEQQVTTFEGSRTLPDPFFVIATQNPVDMGGTYPLPEAQLDRFLMRLQLGYPARHTQIDMLSKQDGRRRTHGSSNGRSAAVLGPAAILEMIRYINAVYAAPAVLADIVAVVEATRERTLLGASPRACIALLRAARAYAAATKATAVTIDHVRDLAVDVLAHRIVLAEASDDDTAAAQRAFVEDVVKATPTAKRGPR